MQCPSLCPQKEVSEHEKRFQVVKSLLDVKGAFHEYGWQFAMNMEKTEEERSVGGV